MKKMLLTGSAFAVLALVSCSPSKEKYKTKFIKDCEQTMSQVTDQGAKKIATEYCECSGQKIVDKFSIKELDEMDKLQTSAPDPAKVQEIQAKMLPVIQPCLTDMQNKANAAGMQSAPPATK